MEFHAGVNATLSVETLNAAIASGDTVIFEGLLNAGGGILRAPLDQVSKQNCFI